MPELPEVETTRRGITPHILGKKVKSVDIRQHSLRWPIPIELPQLLKQKALRSVDRRGKYLLLHFDHGCLLIHLGMSGSLRIVNPRETVRKHDHVDIVFTGSICLRFHDPRRFGAILWTTDTDNVNHHPLLAHLGPEPLSSDFDVDYLFGKSRKRSKDIKGFIMDSKVVVGVGNIYANESLFKAGIRPTKAAGKVTRKHYEKLVDAIKYVLKRSIDQGGTTLRDFVGGNGEPGYFAQQLDVYGREGLACKKCSKPLKSLRQSQRATVYCSHCQS